VNRKSSDGTIIEVRKDNTTVGSIGSKGGDLTLGTGAIGVRFEDSNNAIVPFDTGTLGSSDNDIDLGNICFASKTYILAATCTSAAPAVQMRWMIMRLERGPQFT
jgi:hypothetical protein